MLFAESIYDIAVKDIDGQTKTLKSYEGQVILIVNVASHCGFTPQYQQLQSLFEKYHDQGFTVLGFPCNQFGKQEPGSNEQIKEFCSTKFHVAFPLFDKLEVNGANRHPLYQALAGSDSPFPGDIRWNFTKFLIARDGKVIGRFDSKIRPDASEVIDAITKALATKH